MFSIVRILLINESPRTLARGFPQNETVDTVETEASALAIVQSLTEYPDCPYPCEYTIVRVKL